MSSVSSHTSRNKAQKKTSKNDLDRFLGRAGFRKDKWQQRFEFVEKLRETAEGIDGLLKNDREIKDQINIRVYDGQRVVHDPAPISALPDAAMQRASVFDTKAIRDFPTEGFTLVERGSELFAQLRNGEVIALTELGQLGESGWYILAAITAAGYIAFRSAKWAKKGSLLFPVRKLLWN